LLPGYFPPSSFPRYSKEPNHTGNDSLWFNSDPLDPKAKPFSEIVFSPSSSPSIGVRFDLPNEMAHALFSGTKEQYLPDPSRFGVTAAPPFHDFCQASVSWFLNSKSAFSSFYTPRIRGQFPYVAFVSSSLSVDLLP